MENHTKETDTKRLAEAVDTLTEENQRYFLGVVEALAYAQSTLVPGFLEENSPADVSIGTEKERIK
jgi:hypothetical protein